MSLRNQISILLLLLSAWSFGVQEVTPELRRDITEVVAADAARQLQRLSSGLGDAFDGSIYLETLASCLRDGMAVEDISRVRCPMAADMSNSVLKRFAPQDFDRETAIARIRELAAQPAPTTDAEREKEWENYMQLYDRMANAYRPVLLMREAEQEREILAVNGRRKGVTILPNGVQMEIEPGEDSLADINRGTRETGVAFYTRSTRKIAFSELPEAIRRMAEHIPPARSWTFWIPAETVEALESEKLQKKEAEAARRKEMMSRLVGAQNAHRSSPTYRAPGQKKKRMADKQPEPMLKIKVWKDDETAPVQTLPDVVQDML